MLNVRQNLNFCVLYFAVAQHANSGVSHLVVKIHRSNTVRHTHTVALFWTNDQLLAEAANPQHTTNTRDEHLYPQRDSNSQSQQWSIPRPTP